jgi:hypothetical protein
LLADPTVTATSGQPGQLGTFGGNVYIHFSAMSDTNWTILGNKTTTVRQISGTTDTLLLSDEDNLVATTNISPTTITVPPHSSVAFASGACVGIYCQSGAGVTTIAAGVGVTINNVTLTILPGQGATLIQTTTPNIWDLIVSGGSSIPKINRQSGSSYTLQISDGNNPVASTGSVAFSLVIPLNSSVAFAVDTIIPVIQEGTGIVTPTPVSGAVTINGAAALPGQLSSGTLIYKGSNVWEWISVANLAGGLPVLTLSNDPTTIPVAAAQGQMGTYGGGLYLHYGTGTDVGWILIQNVSTLINNALPILILSADPTVTATISKIAQCGTFGGNLYIHLTAASDTNWRNLATIGAGLPVLTLLADPTGTAAAGQPGQLGTFGGNVYIHFSSTSDTNWKLLGGGLPVLTLSTDPLSVPTAGALGQMGSYGGGLYLHYGTGTDVGWILIQSVANLISNAIPVLLLSADPTTTATAGKITQCGTFGGNLYIHLTMNTDTNWVNLNGTPTAGIYTPASGAQTVTLDGSKSLHFITGNASGTAINLALAGATDNQILGIVLTQGAVASTISAWLTGITIRWLTTGGAPPSLPTANKAIMFGFIMTSTSTCFGLVGSTES